MFVFLVRAKGVEGLDPHDSHYATENIGLLEVNINQLGGAILDMLNALANVTDLQFGRQKGRPGKTVRIERYHARKVSRLVGESKRLLAVISLGRTSLDTAFSDSAQTCKSGNPCNCHLEEHRVVLQPDAFIAN